MCAQAQTEGDALFDTDQVFELRLTFPNADFWPQLNADHAATNDVYRWANAEVIDASGTYTFDSVGVRLKGNSSYDFYPTTKKPIKLDFDRFVDGQDLHGLKKLNLNNCWSDPTFLREKVLFDVCRHEGVLAPRASFVNVYLNDEHWGLYSAVEQVDKTFLDRWLGENDGNLFKAGDNYTPDGGGLGQEADLNYYGATAASYTGRYELKTNEIQNDWSDLIDLLELIDNEPIAVLAAELPERTELDGVMRSLALDNLFGNMDAYYGSARNYYLYHDSTTFKWHWIHWDANMAFGRYIPDWVSDVTDRPATYFSPGRRLLQRIMGNVSLRTQYLNAYCDLFQRFTNADLDPRIDALHDLIAPHVAADNNKEFSTFDFETNIDWMTQGFIPGLKSFIAERRANLLNSTLDCTAAALAELERPEVLSVFPNPTTGSITVALPTGARMTDLAISDALGRAVTPQVIGGTIDLSALPPGPYTLTLATPTGQARAMVVKE